MLNSVPLSVHTIFLPFLPLFPLPLHSLPLPSPYNYICT